MGLIARVMVAVPVNPLASMTVNETVGLNTVLLRDGAADRTDDIECVPQVAITAGGPFVSVRGSAAGDRAFKGD